ncbi:phage tail sheath family protein [Gynuella sunshinyii]|uniref:Phage tail sheath protein FI n=1 Tax=Gynuella sunshinyii YC6258 TaxID=1445510 RepID=A0A0C5VJ28_9GAMM|nr:phage tail sheath C-terminal domain-containing protein [Gynuella sunshinyii]AJQ94241.1 phage tail sheath protein FI [Gynuella sunshinyii YC6258]
MSQYKTPDVYVKERSLLSPSVAEVPTAIPAFIGYTQVTENSRGEDITQKAIRITSMLEYVANFGNACAEAVTVKYNSDSAEFFIPGTSTAGHFLYQSVAHFFANGGGTCYVISIGDYSTTLTENDTTEPKAKDEFIKAINSLSKVDEVTLISCPESVLLSYQDHYDIQNAALTHAETMMDRFALVDVKCSNAIRDDAANMRNKVSQGLKYGAAYYPYLKTSMARSYGEEKVTVTLPDGTEASLSELNNPDFDHYSTAYYNQVKALLATHYLVLPPSAAIAGVMAKTDAQRGVWKAPANVALVQVIAPTVDIDNSEQEDLNVDTVAGKSINAIRSFVGKGTLVWGARTLDGNSNEWRYVPVRRLFNMVEESVKKASYFAVFEPNTPFTWLKIKTTIESYLENLWKQGAFFGTTTDQAFFVNIGLGLTMTEDDINNGIMNIEIGLAAVRPAEFIVLTFSHKSIEG